MCIFQAILLRQGDTGGCLSPVALSGVAPENIPGHPLPAEGHLLKYLKQVTGPISPRQLDQALAGAALQPEEQAWLARADITCWLPLAAPDGHFEGVLLLRVEGDPVKAGQALDPSGQEAGLAALAPEEEAWAGPRELTRAYRRLLLLTEHERQQVARELHDNILQTVLALNIFVGQSQALAGQEETSLDRQIARQIEQNLAMVLREHTAMVKVVRRLLNEMRPAGLEWGLLAALEELIFHASQEDPAGPEIGLLEVNMDGGEPPRPVAIGLFRIAQEALRNALKHARARKIRLALNLPGGIAVLSVRDDGCGFSPPARLTDFTRTDRFGLVSMAERAAAFGGQLKIDSTPGAGAKVLVRIPLDES